MKWFFLKLHVKNVSTQIFLLEHNNFHWGWIFLFSQSLWVSFWHILKMFLNFRTNLNLNVLINVLINFILIKERKPFISGWNKNLAIISDVLKLFWKVKNIFVATITTTIFLIRHGCGFHEIIAPQKNTWLLESLHVMASDIYRRKSPLTLDF